MAAKLKTYRVCREWTVTMESWVTVEAENLTAACAAALEGDTARNSSMVNGSNTTCFIAEAQTPDGDSLEVPYLYTLESLAP
jgi:hypothetical protein